MKKRINVMITERNLKYLDDHAESYEVSRSDILNMLIGEHADILEQYDRDFPDSMNMDNFRIK